MRLLQSILKPLLKRRICEGLLLTFKLHKLFTILPGVSLKGCGIYEPALGRRKSTTSPCGFSTRSFRSRLPWARGRQTTRQHALSPGQAIVRPQDMHRKSESALSEGDFVPKSELSSSHSVTQSCKQIPLTFSGASSLWVTSLKPPWGQITGKQDKDLAGFQRHKGPCWFLL